MCEPGFLKVYEGENYLQQLSQPMGLIMTVADEMVLLDCSHQKFYLFIASPSVRKFLQTYLEASQKTIKKYFMEMVQVGALMNTDMEWVYIVNPYFFPKGDWNDIQEARNYFKCVNDKWQHNLVLHSFDVQGALKT